MKHIVIDARLYGPKHTGLGRYTKNLLIALIRLPEFNKYKFTLLVYPELLAIIKKDLGDKFSYYPITLRHYSISEQLLLPFVLLSLRPSLVHFTHLDKPILYFGKSIVTIHDLIRHFSKGTETSTKNPLFYWPKYIGYLLMTKIILLTSKIIVPSNFWRNYIIKKYHYPSKNIITTYEAVDPSISSSSTLKKPENFLIYTGNLYPHKNLSIVFQALQKLPSVKLKIICARDVFAKRALAATKHLGIDSQVNFLGYVPDKKFKQLYSKALALVHPALLEGFSLTGLEAMALNCPVISSSAGCLPEIYGDSVLYFNPHNQHDLVKQINKIQNMPNLRRRMIALGRLQVNKYSWITTATKTLNFYVQNLS